MNIYLIIYICMAVFTLIVCFLTMAEDGSDGFYSSICTSILSGLAWPLWITLMGIKKAKCLMRSKE